MLYMLGGVSAWVSPECSHVRCLYLFVLVHSPYFCMGIYLCNIYVDLVR